MIKIKPLLVLLSILFLLVSCERQPSKPIAVYNPGEVITLGLSGDSNYVISAGTKGGLLLWNIKERSYKIISKKANPLSAYFIKNSDQFIWQDDKNVFHVQDVNGKELLHFVGKKSFSNIVTSDLRYLFMTDLNWRFYRYDIVKKQWKELYDGYLSFVNKPINFTLSSDDKLLLSSGFCGTRNSSVPLNKPKGKLNLDCIVLWDVDKAEPIKKFWGNVSSTYATLSPDKKYIISGSEAGIGYVFDALSGKRLVKMDDLSLGRIIRIAHTGDDGKDYKWSKDVKNPPPKAYLDGSKYGSDEAVAIKYITPKLYFRFNIDTHFALLYETLSRRPKKYFEIGIMPYPATNDYSRGNAFDTSLKSHILVTGQALSDGINVYQFEPKTEKLYRVWAPMTFRPTNVLKHYSKDAPTLPGISFEQIKELHRVE